MNNDELFVRASVFIMNISSILDLTWSSSIHVDEYFHITQYQINLICRMLFP
jgi:hypothetical protein